MVRSPVRQALVLPLIGLVLVASGPSGEASPTKRPASGWRLRKLQNFRDAGALSGLPRGRIYRSDDPRHRPFEACALLQLHGIRTIVKLNGHQQVLDPQFKPGWGKGPCGLPELVVSLPYNSTRGAEGVSAYHVGASLPEPARQRVVEYVHRQLAVLFTELSKLKENQVPVLVHCSMGRDRTGVVLALLQRLGGASREAVEREYLESQRTVGKVSVVSIQKVLRRVPNVHEFLRKELGLSWWTLYQLRRVILGPKRPAPARP
jgi:hypothetical protein